MKSALFITAGIGNALLLIPLIKELKNRGTVTCVAASPFQAEKIFEGFATKLFDEVVTISNSAQAAAIALKRRAEYDVVYLDYFAGGRKNLLLANAIGKAVITNRTTAQLPKLLSSSICYIQPELHIHEGTQYLRFANPDFKDRDLTDAHFGVEAKPLKRDLPTSFITIQPGSGNNLAPWKTWPVHQWLGLMKWLLREYPDTHLIVLGDGSEQWMREQVSKLGPRVTSLIGKTTMEELPAIVAQSTLHVGSDSGILHIAGCIGTPTVTVWGGSDPDLFGWNKLNAKKHQEVRMHGLSCHPCNRWLQPNTSKTNTPANCPDFLCINDVSLEMMQNSVQNQLARSTDFHAS